MSIPLSEKHHDGLHTVHASDALSIVQRIAEAEQLCNAQSVKLTPLRAEVLTLILQASHSVGAYDLMAQMKNSNRRVAPPTVYRSLDFLMAHGFIHRLASINAYIPCCHPRAGHHAVFLICEQCHSVSESSDPSLLQHMQSLMQHAEFTASATTLEISGICKTCRVTPNVAAI